MAMTDNTTALEALRDQTAALPSAAKSVAGVAFGDSGATGDYAVSGEWLDNTATQMQNLTGATGGLTTTQMTEQLDAANAEKEEQATIIGELTSILAETSTVLDGKAGGSGGVAVETCTVAFGDGIGSVPGSTYMAFDAGCITAKEFDTLTDKCLQDVVKGSILTLVSQSTTVATEGECEVYAAFSSSVGNCVLVRIIGDCEISCNTSGFN